MPPVAGSVEAPNWTPAPFSLMFLVISRLDARALFD
jgi:hypothetical protein